MERAMRTQKSMTLMRVRKSQIMMPVWSKKTKKLVIAQPVCSMNPNQTNTQHWHRKDFVRPNTDFSGEALTDNVTSLHTPLQYFQMTPKMEIQKLLGMYLKMGLVQMSVTHTFWDTDTWHTPIADVICNRSLLTALHFALHSVNNLTVPEIEKKDKLWKFRPYPNSERNAWGWYQKNRVLWMR